MVHFRGKRFRIAKIQGSDDGRRKQIGHHGRRLFLG
jgi:hypothetical protein